MYKHELRLFFHDLWQLVLALFIVYVLKYRGNVSQGYIYTRYLLANDNVRQWELVFPEGLRFWRHFCYCLLRKNILCCHSTRYRGTNAPSSSSGMAMLC